MIKTILVPLDGSAIAEQGLATARRVAKETGASLLLVCAVPYSGVQEGTQESERRELRQARAYLGRIQEELVARGFTAATEVLPVDPVRAILFAAEAHDADVISMCTHGGSMLRRTVLGSIAEAVLRRTATPVLLTHAASPRPQHEDEPFGRIVVALDGTAVAENSLSHLRQSGIGRSAELVLLRAVRPTPVRSLPSGIEVGMAEAIEQDERATDQRRLAAAGYLQDLGATLPHECTWQARAVLGEPGETILHTAEIEGSDLIALATHDRHGWDRLLHGSVTHYLVHHANVPLLILRGPKVDSSPPVPARQAAGVSAPRHTSRGCAP